MVVLFRVRNYQLDCISDRRVSCLIFGYETIKRVDGQDQYPSLLIPHVRSCFFTVLASVLVFFLVVMVRVFTSDSAEHRAQADEPSGSALRVRLSNRYAKGGGVRDGSQTHRGAGSIQGVCVCVVSAIGSRRFCTSW